LPIPTDEDVERVAEWWYSPPAKHAAPRRIVEIGAGLSSALMLDVAERFFDWGIE
jgi:hypothetical protein